MPVERRVVRCHEWTKEVRYYMIVLLGVDKPNETFMTLVCPICKSSAQELPRAGDANEIRMARGDKRPSRALREAIVANLIFGALLAWRNTH